MAWLTIQVNVFVTTGGCARYDAIVGVCHSMALPAL
jgi:hypothetical protein